MALPVPEVGEDDLEFFQKVVRMAYSHYGELNDDISTASSPSELVHELQKARRVLGNELAKNMNDEKRERLLNRQSRITGFIAQVRHTFDLPLDLPR